MQRAFENGTWDGFAARLLSDCWRRNVRVSRRLQIPEGLLTIGVGGGTVGGSGKTALVLELARRAPATMSVAVLARSYPARVGAPRRVQLDDCAEVVGDEPLMLARALAGSGADTWVGPRQATLNAVGERYGVAILDGVLQAYPRPLDWSLLSLDAVEPWGAGRCPPAGDMLAAPGELLGVADWVLGLQRSGAAAGGSSEWRRICELIHEDRAQLWQQRIVAATGADGIRRDIEALRGSRLGLLLALGRPQRLLRELSELGICPEIQVLVADHSRFPDPKHHQAQGLEGWLTTAKCATKLESYYAGVPVWRLEQRTTLPERVVTKCFRGHR